MASMVYLVGAGPGDPGLVTVKGLELIKKADSIIYDRLSSPELLGYAGMDCERIYVGKADRHHTLPQEQINELLVEKAKEYVTKFGGNITNVEEWGKKKLAYEIQHMKEGFYYFIQFDAEADVPAQLEQAVRIMDNVLRYLCVRQEA